MVQTRKKRRATRGAKVHQMAFANLGRNKRKTVLVVISLSLSVVLLNFLVTFTGGFDMEKYEAMKNGSYKPDITKSNDASNDMDGDIDIDLINQILNSSVGEDNG